MKHNIDTIKGEEELERFFEELAHRPYLLEIGISNKTVVSHIINFKEETLFLTEFEPFYTNNLIGRFKRIHCTIYTLEECEEVTREFSAVYLSDHEEDGVFGYHFRIRGAIKGRKEPFIVKPVRDRQYMVRFSTDKSHYEPVSAFTVDEVFIIGDFSKQKHWYGRTIEKVTLSAGRQKIKFRGEFSHIYGNSYCLRGMGRIPSQREKLSEIIRTAFLQKYGIEFFDRGSIGGALKKRKNTDRLILVSDEKTTRRIFQRSLRLMRRISVELEEKGDKLDSLLASMRPVVLFLDMDMYEQTPEDWLKTIAADNAPPCYLLRETLDDRVREAIAYGAWGYLEKPVDSTILIRKMHAFFDPYKLKKGFNVEKPNIVIFSEDRSPILGLIDTLRKAYRDFDDFGVEFAPVWVEPTFQLFVQACREKHATLAIVHLTTAETYSATVIENFRKQFVGREMPVIVIPRDDDDTRLVRALNDERVRMIPLENELDFYEQLQNCAQEEKDPEHVEVEL